MFQGSMTALITPFRDGAVDEKVFQAFVDWQIKEGTEVVVPCGTTGESPTLSHEEHRRVVDLCIEVAKGRVPVIAGAGSNSTQEAISLAQHARKSGADAVLVVTPYYNKPTQEGLYQHFKAINDSAEIPIFIYNIPGRSVVDMSVATMARLAKLPNIVGVKDCTELARTPRQRAATGDDFIMLSGDDATALAYLAQTGTGCISVTANIAPRQCAQMHAAWRQGDVKRAQAINSRLVALHDALFIEASPAPVKFGASLLGKASADVRLPIVPASEHAQTVVRQAMTGAGLLN
ncbi:MAG TPA: 4-hydroxy-tetrahydrodipicolinate synthase [Stellaceae bacterium]